MLFMRISVQFCSLPVRKTRRSAVSEKERDASNNFKNFRSEFYITVNNDSLWNRHHCDSDSHVLQTTQTYTLSRGYTWEIKKVLQKFFLGFSRRYVLQPLQNFVRPWLHVRKVLQEL